MFKKLAILTILVVLALVSSVSSVSARGQISETGVIWVDPLQHTPVQVPIPDISLPVAEPAQSVPATPARGGPPAHASRGQLLVTGSFWIEFDGREVHINLNVRSGDPIFATVHEASGHIHWREVGGENYRMSAIMIAFEVPPGIPFTWPEECAYVRGLFGPDFTQDFMCLQVCGDRVHNLWWSEEHLYSGDFTSGNVVIKQ